ncbi:hypothetical protein, partial [Pseudomonas aeruginosa]|uniref:hypothetical protein n=1 Tax=Pseudomonas aeruginosa TaxID=287 RepID=UPI001ED99E0F
VLGKIIAIRKPFPQALMSRLRALDVIQPHEKFPRACYLELARSLIGPSEHDLRLTTQSRYFQAKGAPWE